MWADTYLEPKTVAWSPSIDPRSCTRDSSAIANAVSEPFPSTDHGSLVPSTPFSLPTHLPPALAEPGPPPACHWVTPPSQMSRTAIINSHSHHHAPAPHPGWTRTTTSASLSHTPCPNQTSHTVIIDSHPHLALARHPSLTSTTVTAHPHPHPTHTCHPNPINATANTYPQSHLVRTPHLSHHPTPPSPISHPHPSKSPHYPLRIMLHHHLTLPPDCSARSTNRPQSWTQLWDPTPTWHSLTSQKPGPRIHS